MRTPLSFCLVFLLNAFVLSNAHAAASADDQTVQKVVKTLINSIRYSKDDLAAQQLAFTSMSKALLTDSWGKMSDADKKDFSSNLETLLRLIAFPKGREIFQYLDAIQYEPVKMQGSEAHCKSNVVIHRQLKKTELAIEWVLTKEEGAWKVLDTISLGEGTAQGIREDQIKPLLAEGGVPAVLEAMHKKVAELKKN